MKFVKKLYFDLPGFGRVNAMPGGTLDIGGFKRDAKIADTGVVGYTEEPMAPSVDFKIAMSPGLSLAQLGELAGVNVTVQTDGGDSYMLAEAWTSVPPKMSGGEIDMKMESIRCDEVG